METIKWNYNHLTSKCGIFIWKKKKKIIINIVFFSSISYLLNFDHAIELDSHSIPFDSKIGMAVDRKVERNSRIYDRKKVVCLWTNELQIVWWCNRKSWMLFRVSLSCFCCHGKVKNTLYNENRSMLNNGEQSIQIEDMHFGILFSIQWQWIQARVKTMKRKTAKSERSKVQTLGTVVPLIHWFACIRSTEFLNA